MGKIFRFVFSVLVVLIFLSCRLSGKGNPGNYPDPIPGAEPFSFGFETEFQDWLDAGGSGERAFEEDIEITDGKAAEGLRSVKFRVTPESNVAGGQRAELTFDARQREGETGTYSWSILIPEDFTDYPLFEETGEPYWQVMGQWHQQPVWFEGETWDDFTGKGESVPVSMNYLYLDRDDPTYLEQLEDPRIHGIDGMNTAWDDQPVFMLYYGIPPEPAAVKAVEKGRWYKVTVTIYWSRTESGYAEAWIDGEPVTDGPVTGPNMLNKESHYFKFGLYRNPDIKEVQTVYYDNFSFK